VQYREFQITRYGTFDDENKVTTQELRCRSFEKLKDGSFRFVLSDGAVYIEPGGGNVVVQEFVDGRWTDQL
jgi:predicted transcriptional regulator